MVRRHLHAIAARERTNRADIHLGVMLAFIAGSINAGGFLAVGRYTSHMTGIVSAIGDELALHQYQAALLSLAFLLSFITGSLVSSLCVNFCRHRHYHSEYAATLMLEAALLLLFGMSATGVFDSVHLSIPLTIALLCFIMGLQNALITKVSHSRIRTTHVTGISTDIGIELGRRLFRLLGDRQLPVHIERLMVPVQLLLAFLSGAITGAFTFTQMGFVAVIPLAVLLVVLAAGPVWRDLKRER